MPQLQIFRDRGIDVDFEPDLGKDKEKLAKVIGQYDGLAIRSATQRYRQRSLRMRPISRSSARAGIGTDNIDKDAASKKGCNRHEYTLRQHDHHSRACYRDDVCCSASNSRSVSINTCRKMGKVSSSMGTELTNKTLGRNRCRATSVVSYVSEHEA